MNYERLASASRVCHWRASYQNAVEYAVIAAKPFTDGAQNKDKVPTRSSFTRTASHAADHEASNEGVAHSPLRGHATGHCKFSEDATTRKRAEDWCFADPVAKRS